MDATPEPYANTPSRPLGEGPAAVAIEDIAFRYSEHHPWLYRGMSLTLPAGKLTLLTGPSGSGKSTLAKLLLGFRRPDEGRIRVDGQDIAFLAANELRAQFGVVPQETVLFSGTIWENLRLAKPDATLDEIVAACRQAEVHAVIEQLPQGYQTLVGEQGVGLSGGQRQRIAIARALLRQPRVLIFDEATSNLDSATAEAFARTVNALRGQATILFIAHQVPRGLAVDRVARLNGPEVHCQNSTSSPEANES
jgi:subfamily B ATP-binding cassette protein HlyB/CyaB